MSPNAGSYLSNNEVDFVSDLLQNFHLMRSRAIRAGPQAYDAIQRPIKMPLLKSEQASRLEALPA